MTRTASEQRLRDAVGAEILACTNEGFDFRRDVLPALEWARDAGLAVTMEEVLAAGGFRPFVLRYIMLRQSSVH